MNKEPEDIDQILPYGELLRGFMEQSFIAILRTELREHDPVVT